MRALGVLAIAGCAAPTLAQVPVACEVEVRRTDGMGTMAHRRGYDAGERLAWGEWSETYSGRGHEEVRYDDAGRVRSVRGLHHESSGSYPGPEMKFTAEASYDRDGRMVKVVTVDAYDNDGGCDRPGRERTWRYRWDAGGRLVEARRSDGRRLRVGYRGERASEVVEEWADIDGHPWTSQGVLTWEGGRLLRIARRICNRAGYCYDDGERFAYDEHGRLVARTPMKGDAWRYRYDERGRLVRRTMLRDRSERPTDVRYDDAGRVAATVDDEGTGASQQRVYRGDCAAATGAERAPDPLVLLGLTPCLPSRVAGCLAPDGRATPRW